jgi:hypothetical protein
MNYIGYEAQLKIGNQEFQVVKWEVNAPMVQCERDFLEFGNFSGCKFKVEAVSIPPYPKQGVFDLKIDELYNDFHFYKEDKYVEYDESDWWWLEKYGYGTIERTKTNTTFTAKEVRIIITSNDTKHIEQRFLKR